MSGGAKRGTTFLLPNEQYEALVLMSQETGRSQGDILREALYVELAMYEDEKNAVEISEVPIALGDHECASTPPSPTREGSE